MSAGGPRVSADAGKKVLLTVVVYAEPLMSGHAVASYDVEGPEGGEPAPSLVYEALAPLVDAARVAAERPAPDAFAEDAVARVDVFRREHGHGAQLSAEVRGGARAGMGELADVLSDVVTGLRRGAEQL